MSLNHTEVECSHIHSISPYPSLLSPQFQEVHHWPCTQESKGNWTKWLSLRSTHFCHHEVLWETRQGSYHLYLTWHPRPTSICLLPQKIHRRCNRHHNCPILSGQEEYLCKNAAHWLCCSSEPHPVQLGPGLPDRPPPGVEDRKQHLHKDVCSAPSCTPCSPMTAWPRTPPTQSSSLQTTTVVGLITSNDETAYREVRALGVWRQENNLSPNVNKTKELIVDFRKQQREHPPIHIDGTAVEKVESFKFLCIYCILSYSTIS